MQRFTGKQYLQIDIAGNFGLDNKSWDERLAWFDAHKDRLLEMMPQAKSPALYFAAVQAWNDTLAGKPSGYPISLDATCSGLQLLAVLTGDRSAARLCNVVPTGNRMDAYAEIYQYMLNEVGGNALVTRDMAKDAILTSLYGSIAVPKQVFGEGNLLNVFFNTMKENAPAAWELNETYLAIWNPEALEYNWVLPDNYHVHIKVMSQVKDIVHFLDEPFDVFKTVNAPVEGGRSLGANTNHSLDGMIVREMTRRCNYNPLQVETVRLSLHLCNKETELFEEDDDSNMVQILWDHYRNTGYLSARIIDHLNETNACLVDHAVVLELLDSLPAKPFEIICIHDCFRCLPNYGNDMRMQYNRQLYLISKSNILSSLLSQIMGHDVKIGKLDATMHLDILDTEYALS